MAPVTDRFESIERELQSLDRDSAARLFAGKHHARYVEAEVPVHVISRVFQGRHLLVPSPRLNSLIGGVLGRGLRNFKVHLYAIAVLSNHVHMMLSGEAQQVAAFVGFFKREISRRWGGDPEIDWPGAMWEEYDATSLPTEEDQEHCLRYILSQGVKEGLVRRAEEWPGVHCSRHLATGRNIKGVWLDSTSYGQACRAEARKLPANRRRIDRRAFGEEQTVVLDPIPAWRHLTARHQRARIRSMLAAIELEGRTARKGRPPLGRRRILETSRERRTSPPRPPWFGERRRMICWSNPRSVETRAYLRRYWEFQRAFREASERLRGGELGVPFPIGACRPAIYARGAAPPA